MSKRSKEKKPAPLADWEVRVKWGFDTEAPIETLTVEGARWNRDERGCCTFRDGQGVVAGYSPGVVLGVRRVDAAHPPIGEDETRQSGYEATGPAILPVKPRSRA